MGRFPSNKKHSDPYTCVWEHTPRWFLYDAFSILNFPGFVCRPIKHVNVIPQSDPLLTGIKWFIHTDTTKNIEEYQEPFMFESEKSIKYTSLFIYRLYSRIIAPRPSCNEQHRKTAKKSPKVRWKSAEQGPSYPPIQTIDNSYYNGHAIFRPT